MGQRELYKNTSCWYIISVTWHRTRRPSGSGRSGIRPFDLLDTPHELQTVSRNWADLRLPYPAKYT